MTSRLAAEYARIQAFRATFVERPSDSPEVAAIRARWRNTVPWQAVSVPMEPSALGVADGFRESARWMIFSAHEHPQLKAPFPVVGEAHGPYYVPNTHVHIDAENARAIGHAPEDVAELLRRLDAAVEVAGALAEALAATLKGAK